MKRLIAPCLAFALVAGCQGRARPPSPNDPFLFGPTRVPPPGTGAAAHRPADPYYRGAVSGAAQPTGGPRGSQAAGESGPADPTRVPPPGRFAMGSRARRTSSTPGAVAEAAPQVAGTAPAAAAWPSSGATGSGLLAGRERYVRVLPPRTGAVGVAGPHTAPADPGSGDARCDPVPSRPRRRRVDISELPPAGSADSASGGRGADATGGFRLVSASGGGNSGSEPAGVTTAAAAEAVSPRSHYGHGPDYSWVHGKLEHSQIDGRWKLRYIPVDGQTDRYGGSVVVADPSVLSGYERGEYLELRGRLAASDPEGGYAPLYEVAEVERLRGSFR